MLIKSDPIDSSANYIDYYINLKTLKVNVPKRQIQLQTTEDSVKAVLFSVPQVSHSIRI